MGALGLRRDHREHELPDDSVSLTSSTTEPVTLFTGGGKDTLTLADNASLGGKFAAGRGSDTVDYSAWTSTVNVNLGREATFVANLTGPQQVPPVTSTATGFGMDEHANAAEHRRRPDDRRRHHRAAAPRRQPVLQRPHKQPPLSAADTVLGRRDPRPAQPGHRG